ncbi:MAG: hypothetical protein L0331_04745 [Chloroflexi bacterium]|nr:hypothetical protein [Chloroflexota bacterium]
MTFPSSPSSGPTCGPTCACSLPAPLSWNGLGNAGRRFGRLPIPINRPHPPQTAAAGWRENGRLQWQIKNLVA